MRGPFKPIGMLSRKQTRLAEIHCYFQQSGLAELGELQFKELHARLSPISASALQKLLRESRLALSPMVEGVRQENFDQLGRTLVRLSTEYSACLADAGRLRHLRRLVIASKDHARFAARSAADESRRREKDEMAQWLLIWLENPPLFPQWLQLRQNVSTSSARSSPPE